MSDLASDASGASPAARPAPSGPPRARPGLRPSSADVARVGIALLPGALILYLSFNSGGFFAGAPAAVATVLGVVLALRVTLADHPWEGLTRPLVVAVAALGLFAAWVLASSAWSDGTARAVLEFDRAAMYWLVVVLLACVRWPPSLLAWAVRVAAGAIVVVTAVALASRLLPDVVTTATVVDNARLGYPLTYWNALGLLAGLGIVLCVHLSSSLREPLAVRALGAGALPVVAGALLFSFSRGGMAVAVIGTVAYLALARPRGMVSTLLAGAPAAGVALAAALGADLLAGDRPKAPAAVAQGHEVAVVVGACVLAATAARAALARLDVAAGRVAMPDRRALALPASIAAAVALVAAVLALTVLGGAGWVGDRYESLVSADASESGDLRARISSFDNNGRVEQWRVALDAFAEAPVAGAGAGAFGRLWARERDGTMKVEDGHSLYLETLAELGAVGLALLLVALLALLAGVGARARGRERELPAVVFACLLTWALHAGIDWDWEMPAVTAWVLALAAMTCAARPGTASLYPVPGRFPRVAIGVGCLALVALPALTAVSQRQLDASVAALKRGDCERALETALSAAEAMPVRPEPFAVLGYCDARLGKSQLAVAMLEAAVERDPGDWQLRYGLALVRAAAGRDPRPAVRAAVRLNPNEPLIREAAGRFRGTDPQRWRRQARAAPLPVL